SRRTIGIGREPREPTAGLEFASPPTYGKNMATGSRFLFPALTPPILFCILHLLFVPASEGQIPANGDLPLKFDWPKVLPKSTPPNGTGWGSSGLVELKRSTPTEPYVELETSERGKTSIELQIERDTA